MSETKQREKKIEINTPMYGYITSQFSYDTILRILRDEFITAEDYLELITEDGIRVAVRKKDIVSIEEVE